MSLGDVLLNEKTRVSINIATLLFVIGFSITATFTFTTWKTEFQITQQSEIVRLSHEIEERKAVDEDIQQEQKENRTVLIETNTQLAEIKTDLKWIRAILETRQ